MLRREHRNMGTGAALAACVAVFVVLSASVGQACEGSVVPRSYFNNPIEVQADGSFEVRAALDPEMLRNWSETRFTASFISGMPVRDVGSGKIGQRLGYSKGCDSTEYLLFVDCASASTILIKGIYREPTSGAVPAGMNFESIDAIQRPLGPIALKATTTVDELEAISRKHDYVYTRDMKRIVEKLPRKQRYDPFNGCKIFYPDSKGAKG